MDKNLTPIEQHDSIYIKRDDLFTIAGVRGGKARTCYYLAQNAKNGLTTAGSRKSPQINIVAHIARHLGLNFNAHTPMGALSPELLEAKAYGANIIQHKAGYNSVIIARAKQDALTTGYTYIPFGMECTEAVNMTKYQVQNIPKGVKRIVVPVGSGMSLAGILQGLIDFKINIPVLGVVVGAAPDKRLNKFAPVFWQSQVKLVNAGVDYHKELNEQIDNITLDPIYEAKCKKFLQPGDLLWVVGIRNNF